MLATAPAAERTGGLSPPGRGTWSGAGRRPGIKTGKRRRGWDLLLRLLMAGRPGLGGRGKLEGRVELVLTADSSRQERKMFVEGALGEGGSWGRLGARWAGPPG